jgi:hypothetical protein
VPLLPERLAARYGSLPTAVETFLGGLELATSADETAWFFTPSDYLRNDPSAISWNECERISRESAETADQLLQIVSFWDGHLPFAMASHSDYDYLALVVSHHSTPAGAIVHGYAPEFECPSLLFRSFDSFLEGLAQQARSTTPTSLLPFLPGAR